MLEDGRRTRGWSGGAAEDEDEDADTSLEDGHLRPDGNQPHFLWRGVREALTLKTEPFPPRVPEPVSVPVSVSVPQSQPVHPATAQTRPVETEGNYTQ